MVVLFFKEVLYCFTYWLHHFAFPLTIQELQFLHNLTNTCLFLFIFLSNSRPDLDGYLDLGLDLNFSDD